jgi:hypothetical protein
MGGARRSERPAAVPPAPADVRQPAVPPRSWRDKVRHAVDLTVAFVLLEDAEPEQHGPGRDAPRPSRASVGAVHPHRKPLRPMPRSRRPGAAAARPQPCLAPVGHVPATPPKRRARQA